LYDAPMRQQASPVVALSGAVAVSQALGPPAALTLVQASLPQPQFAQYHLPPSALAGLLARLGRHDDACARRLRAAELTSRVRERALLLDRAHNTLSERGES
jgi:RNA polymerase sigma-70 factor, ECF subfamily